jgi:hypothetical protein
LTDPTSLKDKAPLLLLQYLKTCATHIGGLLLLFLTAHLLYLFNLDGISSYVWRGPDDLDFEFIVAAAAGVGRH